jgi:hypothetical protein
VPEVDFRIACERRFIISIRLLVGKFDGPGAVKSVTEAYAYQVVITQVFFKNGLADVWVNGETLAFFSGCVCGKKCARS